MDERRRSVTVIEKSGRRRSLDVRACSTFDAAHIFVTHAKADPRNGIPHLSLDSVFEVVVKGKIHRIERRALQHWILKEREERKGPRGFFFRGVLRWMISDGEARRVLNSSQRRRDHFPDNTPNHFQPMFPGTALQGIRPLKCLGASNLHLPPVIGLRSDNGNPPVSGAIGKHVFNSRNDFAAHKGIAGVVHLHRDCHIAVILG